MVAARFSTGIAAAGKQEGHSENGKCKGGLHLESISRELDPKGKWIIGGRLLRVFSWAGRERPRSAISV